MDDRFPESGPPERVQLSPPADLSRKLLEIGYPADEYPDVPNLQSAYLRSAGEVIRQRQNGGMPPEIFEALRTAAETQGGLLPLVLSADDSALIQTVPGGGVRISKTTVEDENGGETAVMQFEELTDEEFRQQTTHIDSETLIAWIVRLSSVRDDIDVREILAGSWAESGVSLAEVFETALDQGYVDAESLQTAVESATGSDA